MSQKSSRAQKAVSTAERKTGNRPAQKAAPKKAPPEDHSIPGYIIAAAISFVVFFFLVVMAVNPEGLLTHALQTFVLGLVGRVAFYLLIPVTLFLLFLNVLNPRKDVKGQTACAVLFAFFVGCIHHLIVQQQGMAQGFAVVADLYLGGRGGRSAGVLCGGVAMMLRSTCGAPISYVIFVLLALLTLLGSFGITIPGLVRAIAARPRDEWEEETQTKPEPAEAVVNHIANKRIEKKRKAREAAIQPPPAAVSGRAEPMTVRPAQPRTKAEPVRPAPPVQAPAEQITPSNKAVDFMSAVDQDISAPMFGAAAVEVEGPEEYRPDFATLQAQSEPISRMPAFETESSVTRVKVKPAPVRPVRVEAEEVPVEEAPKKVTAKEAQKATKQVAREIARNQAAEPSDYCFPPINLLRLPVGSAADGTEEMRDNSRRLNETLASFHIDAHITNVTRGPSVTRYEVELDKGVRLNKLTNCADDIALSLGASGVRIAAVPGKISIVGIEVPNRSVTNVSLREVLDSPEFARAKSKSSFAVGKDIGGNCIVGNIAKMPHMLIAGTTGSGKSVCMNSIIISLLYKASPSDVKLIMVDPKMVELGIYNGIPHLLIPVVTDPKKAAGSLQWAVTEMLRRYKLMSDAGVRDLESYNSIVTADGEGEKLPQIVVIIDELADLMLVAAKEVEDSICRIAQMGRASGMHLIIATQRPSADVITGLMKANIPSRIAFSVASAMESRIILDTQGAEKLVGKGDMLFAPIGCGKPMRVQGCFVTDGEVESVASYVKEHYSASYNQEVLEDIEKKALQTGKAKTSVAEADTFDEELDGDEMLPAAVDVILETGQASVSMLQRRLKLGYARAARIVDEMEEKGIVGPFQGSKPRAILITKEQWAAQRGGEQMSMDDMEPPFDVED